MPIAKKNKIVYLGQAMSLLLPKQCLEQPRRTGLGFLLQTSISFTHFLSGIISSFFAAFSSFSGTISSFSGATSNVCSASSEGLECVGWFSFSADGTSSSFPVPFDFNIPLFPFLCVSFVLPLFAFLSIPSHSIYTVSINLVSRFTCIEIIIVNTCRNFKRVLQIQLHILFIHILWNRQFQWNARSLQWNCLNVVLA